MAVELDAIDPPLLKALVTGAITGALDLDALEVEREAERAELGDVLEARERALAALGFEAA